MQPKQGARVVLPMEHVAPHEHGELFDHDSAGDSHGTEMGWLVSYADMMTLLFGLFVILFSLSQDKSKSVESVMEEVSTKFFNSNLQKSSAKVSVQSPEVILKESKATLEAETKRVAEKDRVLSEQRTQLARERASFEQQKSAMAAAQDNPRAANPEEVVNKLSSANSALKSSLAKKDSEIESLKQGIQTKERDSKGLQNEIDRLKQGQNKAPMQSYLMVVLTWETEKHDIDLQVVNPHAKLFNFKKRKIAGEPGEFTIDSRYGPGIELWKSENFVPGSYHAKVSLYNKNGNKSPAKATLTVVTNRSTYKSEAIVLPSQGDEGDIAFSVNADGAVAFGQ